MKKRLKIHLINGKSLSITIDDDLKYTSLLNLYKDRVKSKDVMIELKGITSVKTKLFLYIGDIIGIEEEDKS